MIFRPYQLVSLGEMLLRYATLYCTLDREIGKFERWLEDKKLTFPPDAQKVFANPPDKDSSIVFILGVFKHENHIVNLPSVAKQIARIEAKLNKDLWDFDDIIFHVRALRERLQDDLQSQHFLYIPEQFVPSYEEGEKGWEGVILKWGTLSYDIKEAGKCLALGRSTATVFHLMRIIEKGGQLLLKALGVSEYQGIPVEELVIKNILEALNKEVEAQINPSSSTAKKDKAFVQNLSEARMYIFSCKEAWRNPVMHPTSTWTLEEAIDIYGCTRKFANFLTSII